MAALPPIISVTLASSLILFGINLNLFLLFRERAIMFWTCAWGLYSLRFVFDLMRFLTAWSGWSVLVQTTALASGLLLLWGVFEYVSGSGRLPWIWIASAIAAAVWTVGAALAQVGPPWQATPGFVYLGLSNLAISWLYRRRHEPRDIGRRTVVIAFFLWGVHKLDYPFLQPIPGVAVWGYAAGAALAMAAGVGLLMMYLAREGRRADSSERRFGSLVDSLDDFVFTVDAAGRITGVFGRWRGEDDLRASELVGHPAAEVLGPEAARIHLDAARSVFATSEPATYEFELSQPAGSRYYQTSLSPILDPDGRCREVVGAARDVTELREALVEVQRRLAEKDVLLREVNHRVKNNLQIVASLLALQSQGFVSPEAREAIDASMGRIQAMAEVHEHLYGVPDLARIPASTFVRHLADRMMREHGVPKAPLVSVDTEGVAVSIEHAIPLCLMLSELIALQLPRLVGENTRGELRIRMRRSGPSIQLTVDVRAAGTGGAFAPQQGNANELSVKLVMILADQLRGVVEHGFDGDGPFRLVFPAA